VNLIEYRDMRGSSVGVASDTLRMSGRRGTVAMGLVAVALLTRACDGDEAGSIVGTYDCGIEGDAPHGLRPARSL